MNFKEILDEELLDQATNGEGAISIRDYEIWRESENLNHIAHIRAQGVFDFAVLRFAMDNYLMDRQKRELEKKFLLRSMEWFKSNSNFGFNFYGNLIKFIICNHVPVPHFWNGTWRKWKGRSFQDTDHFRPIPIPETITKEFLRII